MPDFFYKDLYRVEYKLEECDPSTGINGGAIDICVYDIETGAAVEPSADMMELIENEANINSMNFDDSGPDWDDPR